MGRRCCVAGCQSTSRLPEHQGVTYHTFPLDPAIRSVWLKHTKCPPDKQITKSVLVCSRHFRRADFNPIRNGKYMLKHRVFPTVFPWGKVDSEQVSADQELLKKTAGQMPPLSPPKSAEELTRSSVEETVKQIFKETAQLNAARSLKSSQTSLASNPSTSSLPSSDLPTAATSSSSETDTKPSLTSPGLAVNPPAPAPTSVPSGYKYEAVTAFNPGARVEAQDFEGIWHSAKIVEVDNDDREVLIRFERTGRMKSAVDGTEEWIPMSSSRLRQKVSTRPIPVFELEERCLARWSGPRKFPATVKKVLGNDNYEVLFDDGFTKTVRALHMNKANDNKKLLSDQNDGSTTPVPNVYVGFNSPAKTSEDSAVGSGSSSAKKRSSPGSRRDWPLLDLAKLDLAALNLPEIPQDGEWTCHWVNDQPIGKEGYLVVGEHRKPTVVVDDWRLPTGWVKHMYQRSNVLGKWDVILVSPSGKRFRSKSDLKTYLEEKGEVYNPDIYDFSIHRRRAKDINAYAYTPDYTPPQPSNKSSSMDSSMDMTLDEKAAVASSLENAVLSKINSQYLETPIASATPPMELLTSPTIEKMSVQNDLMNADSTKSAAGSGKSTPSLERGATDSPSLPPLDDGFVYIGGLKVQLVNNLFRCPDESCSKHFRKENHLQMHVKHYHRDLTKLLGSCPKMLELAAKRTHTISTETPEPAPKNQIPNQQFFAKLHQQDLEQSRAHKRNLAAANKNENEKSPSTLAAAAASLKSTEESKSSAKTSTPSTLESSTTLEEKKTDSESLSKKDLVSSSKGDGDGDSSSLEPKQDSSLPDSTKDDKAEAASSSPSASNLQQKDKLSFRHRFASNLKKESGSRRSSRQRTTRKFLTTSETKLSAVNSMVFSSSSSSKKPLLNENFGTMDLEESRKSLNSTPENQKRRSKPSAQTQSLNQTPLTPATPLSCVDSPVTADSYDEFGLGSFIQINRQETIDESALKIEKMKKTEIINCLCGYGEEDGLMIQCELCLCWQHATCNGIEKEEEVPEPYFCYICRHPHKAREQMLFMHDQHWLYEGKLATANYHTENENLSKRFDYLKKTHRIAGNLMNLKSFMHTIKGKICIASNRNHPKLYLWATEWDPAVKQEPLASETNESPVSEDNKDGVVVKEEDDGSPEAKKIKLESEPPEDSYPNAPKPEAAIDPEECQERLQKHIRFQQKLISDRLDEFDKEIEALENEDDLNEFYEEDVCSTKELLTHYMRDLNVLCQMARINRGQHLQRLMKIQQEQPQHYLQYPLQQGNGGGGVLTTNATIINNAQPSSPNVVV